MNLKYRSTLETACKVYPGACAWIRSHQLKTTTPNVSTATATNITVETLMAADLPLPTRSLTEEPAPVVLYCTVAFFALFSIATVAALGKFRNESQKRLTGKSPNIYL